MSDPDLSHDDGDPGAPDRDPTRAVLVAVRLTEVSESEFEESLAELGRLASTLGLVVCDTLTQTRGSFHPGSYIGSGKLDELNAALAMHNAGTVLLDHEVTPSQARNLEKTTGAEVMDRTAVILEIFHRHARSRAAKAQVEIVRLEYMAPRLREQGKGRDRQRGGIGGKGSGESGMELDRRKIRDR
ncbi:MAG TPA: GTPase HflX, partial [Polyangia bacterium]